MIAAALFLCTVTGAGVVDSDTLRCAEGPRVRLQAINGRERDGSCRKTMPCVAASPEKAKAALSRLVVGKTLRCEPMGRSYARISAYCRVGGLDVSCEMLRAGVVAYVPEYDRSGRLARCGR